MKQSKRSPRNKLLRRRQAREFVRTTKRNGAKRQNGRIKSRTVNMRTRRAAARRAEQTKKIPRETRKIQSPSIIPEIQQTEPMGITNSREIECYMLNEAEHIRTFGWWGLH
jgi:hypothetical protein